MCFPIHGNEQLLLNRDNVIQAKEHFINNMTNQPTLEQMEQEEKMYPNLLAYTLRSTNTPI